MEGEAWEAGQCADHPPHPVSGALTGSLAVPPAAHDASVSHDVLWEKWVEIQ